MTDPVAEFGYERGYFASKEELETFRAEVKYLLATRRAAPILRVWFNIGVQDSRTGHMIVQQGSSLHPARDDNGRVFAAGSKTKRPSSMEVPVLVSICRTFEAQEST